MLSTRSSTHPCIQPSIMAMVAIVYISVLEMKSSKTMQRSAFSLGTAFLHMWANKTWKSFHPKFTPPSKLENLFSTQSKKHATFGVQFRNNLPAVLAGLQTRRENCFILNLLSVNVSFCVSVHWVLSYPVHWATQIHHLTWIMSEYDIFFGQDRFATMNPFHWRSEALRFGDRDRERDLAESKSLSLGTSDFRSDFDVWTLHRSSI